MVSEFRLFTRNSVTKAKLVVANPDEPADPDGGRGFADWAMLTLQAYRIELGKSHRQAIDILTALVDVKTLYIFDVHCTTSKKSDAKIGPQVARRNAGDLRSLAADRAYDGKPFRDDLRAVHVRPLIKHRFNSSLDLADNARMSSRWYNQRRMVETVFSSNTRSLGSAVGARSRFLEFREMVLKYAVYNLHRSVRYP